MNQINLIQEIITAVESIPHLYLYREKKRLEVLMSNELYAVLFESVARIAGMDVRVSDKLHGCVWAIASYVYGPSSQVFEYVSSYSNVDDEFQKTITNKSLLLACKHVISCVESLGWVTKDCNAFDKLKLEISMQQ